MNQGQYLALPITLNPWDDNLLFSTTQRNYMLVILDVFSIIYLYSGLNNVSPIYSNHLLKYNVI